MQPDSEWVLLLKAVIRSNKSKIGCASKGHNYFNGYYGSSKTNGSQPRCVGKVQLYVMVYIFEMFRCRHDMLVARYECVASEWTEAAIIGSRMVIMLHKRISESS